MAIVFDGKKFASEKKERLKIKVAELKKNNLIPRLVSILIGENAGNTLYTKLKKIAAEEIGAEFEVVNLSNDVLVSDLIEVINKLNTDPLVHGIMIQMPLPDNLKNERIKVIEAIDPQKDVDGLRENGQFLHPTSKAIIDVIESAGGNKNYTYVVVGATGMVGMPLATELKKRGYKVIECDIKTVDLKAETLKADILISATGVPGLIQKDMVKGGVIAIDVGYPVGDMESGVQQKADFITPVPGGIGPVTISCLLENLITACYNSVS